MTKGQRQFRLVLAGLMTLVATLPDGYGGVNSSDPSKTGAATTALVNSHWAYQPIRDPVVPAISDKGERLSPIDAFIAEKLASAGLGLAVPADRRTLIRRASIDLVGLPPTFEESEAFAADAAPDAFAKLVDRLLASPRYGERWGRHWLDVARFAETKDLVLLFGKDRLQPYAYTYRDYVIRAFNLDTPYDRFVQEQLAADQLEPKVEPWRLAALGLLTVGRLFDDNPHDQIDDQIDTVTRGFLAMTVACARCHHHKYDPIPTEDYYSLYGVFSNTERPYDLPLIEDPYRVADGPQFEESLRKARQRLQDHIDAQYEMLSETARQRAGDYLVRIATTPKPDISETSSFALSLSPEELRPGLVFRWRRYLEKRAQPGDPVFGLWQALASLPEDGFTDRAKALLSVTGIEARPGSATVIGKWESEDRSSAITNPNTLLRDVLGSGPLSNKVDVARVYSELLQWVYRSATLCDVEQSPALLSPDECDLLAVIESKESPCSFPPSGTPEHMSRVEKDLFDKLVRELDKLAAYATNPPPARAMVVADLAEPREPHVFVRGSPARLGKQVPRQFLGVLAPQVRRPFTHGSGRLDLARAITSPGNPLTSRVLVNRVWMHHFGEPLVGSPNDFGTRSEPPTHPELLDYLARSFVHEGWSLKQLHRRIMLTRVYQQSSRDRPECRQVDPDNRLLWRAQRRRLDFESMRDAMLAVSGRLDRTMGGRSADVAADPLNGRRTVYGLVDRQDLPALFRAFDFACPDQSVERRPRTVVPQQALFAMNSAFAQEQARALAPHSEGWGPVLDALSARSGPSGAEQSGAAEREVDRLYRTVLGRHPDGEERQEAVQFLSEAGAARGGTVDHALLPLEQFAQVLLMSNEFMFVD